MATSFAMRHSRRRANQAVSMKKNKPKPVTTLAMWPETKRIKLHNGKEFVLIFNVSSRHIPDGVSVIPESGGGKPIVKQKNETEILEMEIRNAKIDLPSLASRVSVESINVRSKGEYCRVYVNCTAGMGVDVGFNYWAGPYERFVKWALMKTWEKVFQRDSDGRMSLELRNFADASSVKAKIFFQL